MENRSSSVISLNTLDVSRETSWVLFSVLSLCYIFMIVLNAVIIITVVLSPELHKPMYMFLCNLAVADIVGSSTIIPKQLQMLASGNNEISFLGCLGQTFCVNLFVMSESLCLSFISTDRYLAICKPLRYHAILPLKRSMNIIFLAWLATTVASAIIFACMLSLQMKAGDRKGDSAFCYSISIINSAVSDTSQIKMVVSVIIIVFLGLPPFMLLYTFFRVCLEFARPSSLRLSKKAKETLITQLLVTLTYFISLMTVIIRGRLKQSRSSGTDSKNLNYALELFILVPAAANAFIYGLRVNVLRKAIVKLFQKGSRNRQIIVKSNKTCPHTRHGRDTFSPRSAKVGPLGISSVSSSC